MRTLLTRSVRPRTSRHGSVGAQILPSASRRVIVPPGRRKLTFNDAFTILLGPVLAMAFMADSSWKDKQREAWDQKLLEVHEEIEMIRQKELQRWSNIQIRSARMGVTQQLRNYSTSARLCDTISQAYENLDSHDESDTDIEPFRSDLQDEESDLLPRTVEQWHHWEKLIASKLALEMILYIRTGKSVFLRQFAPSTDPALFSDDLNDLTSKLHQIQRQVTKLIRKNTSEPVPASLLRTHGRMQLHQHLAELARSGRRRTITIPEMVYGYADAIANSETSPYELTYSMMLRTFSALNDETLAFSVMGAMKLSRQRLSNRSIFQMLWQHGQFQDSGRLEEFLKLLTKPDSLVKPWTPWQRITVDNVEISVPSVYNPKISTLLVRVALQCGILHKAEAWAAYMFQQARDTPCFSYCFRSILQYCADNSEWKTGHAWIQKVIEWAAAIAREAPYALSKTVFRALDLCVACNRRDEYSRILYAAVSANIPVPPINQQEPSRFTDRALSIRNDWLLMLERSDERQTSDDIAAIKSAMQFQKILARGNSDIDRFIGLTTAMDILQVRQDASTNILFPYSTLHQQRLRTRPEKIANLETSCEKESSGKESTKQSLRTDIIQQPQQPQQQLVTTEMKQAPQRRQKAQKRRDVDTMVPAPLLQASGAINAPAS